MLSEVEITENNVKSAFREKEKSTISKDKRKSAHRKEGRMRELGDGSSFSILVRSRLISILSVIFIKIRINEMQVFCQRLCTDLLESFHEFPSHAMCQSCHHSKGT